MPDPKIFTFSPNSLNELQMCARKYQFSKVMQLQPPEKALALDRGSMLHEMLATYRILLKLSWSRNLTKNELAHLTEYKVEPGIYPWKEIVEASIMTGRQYFASAHLSPEESEETIYQFTEYVDFYQNDGWQPIEVEATFSKILYESPELILIFEGVIDLITDSRAGRTLVDSKSASRRQEPHYLSNQFIGYASAIEVPTVTVDKVGFQKTKKPHERFHRYVLSYPQAIKDEWREWAIYWGKIMVFYIDNGIFPPNFTSCDKYGGCIYGPICSTTPGARDWKAATLFRKVDSRGPLAKAMATETQEHAESE